MLRILRLRFRLLLGLNRERSLMHVVLRGTMRYLIATFTLLLTASSLNAGFAGFEVGNSVAITGEFVGVNYNADKAHSISLGSTRLMLIEVQLTLTNGQVKRHTMLFAGAHALRVPLPIELTEVLAPLCFLGLVGGIIILAFSFRSRIAEQLVVNGRKQGGATATSSG